MNACREPLSLTCLSVLLAACTAAASPAPGATSTPAPNTPAPTSAVTASPVPPSPSAVATSGGTPWPTINPVLAIGDLIRCASSTPAFLPALLNNRPDALNGTDAVSAALREFVQQPNRLPAPRTTGWRRVTVTSTDAVFVATGPSGVPWYYVHLATTGAGQQISGWYFVGSSECRPEVDLGPEIRRAELYLDPKGQVGPNDRAIQLLLSELSCSSWKVAGRPGRISAVGLRG